jgi:hypothetical protein
LLPCGVADAASERHDADRDGFGNPCDIDIERRVAWPQRRQPAQFAGWANPARRWPIPSNIIRIMIEHRCQPEPDRPPSIELGRLLIEMHRLRIELAAARISSRETWRGPKLPKRPAENLQRSASSEE